jgi:hypothetical protein
LSLRPKASNSNMSLTSKSFNSSICFYAELRIRASLFGVSLPVFVVLFVLGVLIELFLFYDEAFIDDYYA